MIQSFIENKIVLEFFFKIRITTGNSVRIQFGVVEGILLVIPLQLFKSYCAECDKFYKNN